MKLEWLMRPLAQMSMLLGVMTLAIGCGSSGGRSYATREDFAREGPPPPPPQEFAAAEPAGDGDPVEFHNELSAVGTWVEEPQYGGQVFQPSAASDPNWQPYQNGQWAQGDAGVVWNAAPEEPWGDITYHYGRWARTPRYGWVWVPGTVWAPAWVSWRTSDRYSGWAPLPPEVSPYATTITEVDVRSIPTTQYIFVENRYITDRYVVRHAVPRTRNVEIVNTTTNITNITINRGRASNRTTLTALKTSTQTNFTKVNTRVAQTPAEAQAIRKQGGVPIMTTAKAQAVRADYKTTASKSPVNTSGKTATASPSIARPTGVTSAPPKSGYVNNGLPNTGTTSTNKDARSVNTGVTQSSNKTITPASGRPVVSGNPQPNTGKPPLTNARTINGTIPPTQAKTPAPSSAKVAGTGTPAQTGKGSASSSASVHSPTGGTGSNPGSSAGSGKTTGQPGNARVVGSGTPQQSKTPAPPQTIRPAAPAPQPTDKKKKPVKDPKDPKEAAQQNPQ